LCPTDNGVEEENDRGNVSEDDSTVDAGNDQSDENEEEVAGPSDNSSEWVKILHKYGNFHYKFLSLFLALSRQFAFETLLNIK